MGAPAAALARATLSTGGKKEISGFAKFHPTIGALQRSTGAISAGKPTVS
jgi:hypothetical protein